MDKKALSLPILISLVVGNMIGTGIYLLPASLAEYGPISLFSWVYTSLGALLLALTLTHLNKRIPKTGGPYVYCREAFGRLPGFMVGYTYWISNMVSIAGITVASIGYLGFIIPSFNANNPAYNPLIILAVELATLWLFTIINIIGIHTAGVVQLFLTILKIAPLLIITIFGLGFIHFDNLSHFSINNQSDFSAMSSAAALTFWAFIGLESATVPAENTAGYRDISKATITGTLLTALIYIGSTFVLMGMIPAHTLQHSQFPFAEAGTIIFGAYAAFVIMICAVLSGLGTLNGCVLLQGQIVFAAARDKLFPKIFSKLSKNDAPIAGQIFSSILISLFLFLTIEPTLLKQFNFIALLAALLTLFVYFATTLAELKFLLAEKKSYRHIFKSKSFVIAILAAVYAVWMISSFDQRTLLFAIGTLVVIVPVYFLVSR